MNINPASTATAGTSTSSISSRSGKTADLSSSSGPSGSGQKRTTQTAWQSYVKQPANVSYSAGGPEQAGDRARLPASGNAADVRSGQLLIAALVRFQLWSRHPEAGELADRIRQLLKDGGKLDLRGLSPDAIGEVPDKLLPLLADLVTQLILPQGTPDATRQRWQDALHLATDQQAGPPLKYQAVSQGSGPQRTSTAAGAMASRKAVDHLADLLGKIDRALRNQDQLAPAQQLPALVRALEGLAQDNMLIHQLDMAIPDAARSVLAAWRQGEPASERLAGLYAACNAQLPPDRQINLMPAAAPAPAQDAAPVLLQVRRTRNMEADARNALMFSLHTANPMISDEEMATQLNAGAGKDTWQVLKKDSVGRMLDDIRPMWEISEGRTSDAISAQVYRMLRDSPGAAPAQFVEQHAARHTRNGSFNKRVNYLFHLAQTGINCGGLKGTKAHVDASVETAKAVQTRQLAVLQLVASTPALSTDETIKRVVSRLGMSPPEKRSALVKHILMARQIHADRNTDADAATTDAGAVYALLRKHPALAGNDEKTVSQLRKAWNPDNNRKGLDKFTAYRSLSLLALQHGVFGHTLQPALPGHTASAGAGPG